MSWNPPWLFPALGSLSRGRSTVWHGSNHVFTEFRPTFLKKPGVYGPGFYFAEREDEASELEHLYRVEIDVRAPLIIGPAVPGDRELVRLYSAFGIPEDRARAAVVRWREGEKIGIKAHPIVMLTSSLAARFKNEDATRRLADLGYDSIVIDHRTMNAVNAPAGPFYSGDWVSVLDPRTIISLERVR